MKSQFSVKIFFFYEIETALAYFLTDELGRLENQTFYT